MTEHLTETPPLSNGIANPWVLGLYALAATAFVVGTHMAGWYGNDSSLQRLAPFAIAFGIVQLLTAMKTWERGDELATAVLGVWGAFWLGYGILGRPAATTPTVAGASPELAVWLIVTAAITWIATLAAAAERPALAAALGLLAAAATLGAVGEGIGSHGVALAAGWVFAAAGVVGWYVSTAMLLAASGGRRRLPLVAEPRMRTAPSPPADMHRTVPTARSA